MIRKKGKSRVKHCSESYDEESGRASDVLAPISEGLG
jgi:hypothetical protein